MQLSSSQKWVRIQKIGKSVFWYRWDPKRMFDQSESGNENTFSSPRSYPNFRRQNEPFRELTAFENILVFFLGRISSFQVPLVYLFKLCALCANWWRMSTHLELDEYDVASLAVKATKLRTGPELCFMFVLHCCTKQTIFPVIRWLADGEKTQYIQPPWWEGTNKCIRSSEFAAFTRSCPQQTLSASSQSCKWDLCSSSRHPSPGLHIAAPVDLFWQLYHSTSYSAAFRRIRNF